MLVLILLVFALVLFICAAAGVNAPRVSLGWAGLACWVGFSPTKNPALGNAGLLLRF